MPLSSTRKQWKILLLTEAVQSVFVVQNRFMGSLVTDFYTLNDTHSICMFIAQVILPAVCLLVALSTHTFTHTNYYHHAKYNINIKRNNDWRHVEPHNTKHCCNCTHKQCQVLHTISVQSNLSNSKLKGPPKKKLNYRRIRIRKVM